MSGGSYNYLCHRNTHEFVDFIPDGFDQMVDRLVELGYEDAAEETEQIKLMANAFRVRMEIRIDRLRHVWKAVEWYDSCDSGMELVEQAMKKYRDED